VQLGYCRDIEIRMARTTVLDMLEYSVQHAASCSDSTVRRGQQMHCEVTQAVIRIASYAAYPASDDLILLTCNMIQQFTERRLNL
jgi:hypothetical protein